MTQYSLYTDGENELAPMLAIRDSAGTYRQASRREILAAARALITIDTLQGGPLLDAAHLVKEFLQLRLVGLEHEVCVFLLLDNQHRLITYLEPFRGTLSQAGVYPREVVKLVLQHNAAAVIMAHNHPSGHAKPSVADRDLTQRLKQALALIDVRLLDHIIVGGCRTVSLAECGLL